MHLSLSLPEHLAQHTAFAGGPFTQADAVASPLAATVTTEPPDDDGGSSSNTAGAVVQIGIFLLIPIGMYFLLIRPQRRRAREQQALQRSIAVGDEVLLTSGVYGFVTAIESDSDVTWVEIDDDVQIRVTRSAISGKVNPTGGVDSRAASAASAASDDDDAEPVTPSTSRPTLKGSAAASTNGPDSTEPADE